MAQAVDAESAGSGTELPKGLKQRHLTMIAIGGVIGAGLFVGSGVVIKSVGPGAFLTYALSGVLIVMVMRMLGEMATASPATGSFADDAREALGGWAADYFVCVPAHPLHTSQGAGWSADASVIAARKRLETVLEILRGEGLRADGQLGDHRPLHAMDDAVQAFTPDLIVISTHPEERSRWLFDADAG
ncbi:MAG: hypothetical protein U1E42_14340 [Rhodospirillales bacterium]